MDDYLTFAIVSEAHARTHYEQLSAQAKEALGRGASAAGTTTTTGDGGMTPEERAHRDLGTTAVERPVAVALVAAALAVILVPPLVHLRAGALEAWAASSTCSEPK